jgi:anti-sigma factor RsiW
MTPRDRIPDHPEELTLLDYLVGQLSPEASHEIQRHVASCRACRRTIADLSMTVDELDRLPTVAIPHDSPPGLRSGRLRAGRPARRLVPVVAVLIAAVVAVVAIGLGRGSSSAVAQRDLTVAAPRGSAVTAEVLRRYLDGTPGVIEQLPHGDWVILVRDTSAPAALRALQRHAGGDARVWLASVGRSQLPPAG